MGDDARARGVHFILGPGLNIYRAPMAGRNFEYLEKTLSSFANRSPLSGRDSGRGVIATIKHFAGNNQEYDRQKISSDIDEGPCARFIFPPLRPPSGKRRRAQSWTPITW